MRRPTPVVPAEGQESVWDYPRPPALDVVERHVIVASGDVVLAGVDFAVERGHRFGGGVNEKFWRATVSLLASGL